MVILTVLVLFTIAVVISSISVTLGFKVLDIIKAKYGS
jgi:hypothetical protein